MKVAASSRREGTVYEIEGHIDSKTSSELSLAVTPALVPGGGGVALDFRRVTYISSAGLRIILVAAKKARACDLRFVLFGLHNPVREMFEITGFDRILSIVGTEAEALGLLRDGTPGTTP